MIEFNKKMRNILALIKNFFLFSFSFTVVCIGAYYFFFLSTHLIAGEKTIFPPFSVVFFMIPYALVFAVIVACFFVAGTVISQEAHIAPALFSALLFLFTWYALIPAFSLLQTSIKVREPAVDRRVLSVNYFRKYDGGIYFFTHSGLEADTENEVFSGVDMKKGETGKTIIEPFYERLWNTESDSGAFSDILIADTLKFPAVMQILRQFFEAFYQAAKDAFFLGAAGWSCFASIAFPFASCLALSHASRWKLTNLCTLLFLASAVIIVNCMFYAPESFENIKGLFSGAAHKIVPKAAESADGAGLQKYVPIMFMNASFSVALIVLALVLKARKIK